MSTTICTMMCEATIPLSRESEAVTALWDSISGITSVSDHLDRVLGSMGFDCERGDEAVTLIMFSGAESTFTAIIKALAPVMSDCSAINTLDEHQVCQSYEFLGGAVLTTTISSEEVWDRV